MTRPVQAKRRRRERGNEMVEFALAMLMIFPIFTGVFQFGYAYYMYNSVQTAVRNAARYAAVRTYDSSTAIPSSAFRDAVRNMVLYGDPAGSGPLSAPNLQPENVRVQMTFQRGAPAEVSVAVINYGINAVFTTFDLNGKPNVSFPYLGRWDPI